jgi:glycosyltransferase involved in cell wall biosynthesis
MLISIVTPSFNQAPYLEATIRSVLEQDDAQIEYIVVDGGSKDGSREILERYSSRLAWWVSEPDHGQTEAINKGFARATGDVLAWLNSDDTYNPGALHQAIEALSQHPQAAMVYGDANYIDETGKIIGRFPAAQTDYARLRQGYVHIPQQSSFWRAEYWRKVGPLDPSFYFAMDYDLWVRLSSLAPLAYIPGKTWANFRLHRGAKTISADDRCWPEMLRVHARLGGSRFAPIVFKYYLRKLAAPYIRWKRQKLFE